MLQTGAVQVNNTAYKRYSGYNRVGWPTTLYASEILHLFQERENIINFIGDNENTGDEDLLNGKITKMKVCSNPDNISVYGLRKMPITNKRLLWVALLDLTMMHEIVEFITKNFSDLAWKNPGEITIIDFREVLLEAISETTEKMKETIHKVTDPKISLEDLQSSIDCSFTEPVAKPVKEPVDTKPEHAVKEPVDTKPEHAVKEEPVTVTKPAVKRALSYGHPRVKEYERLNDEDLLRFIFGFCTREEEIRRCTQWEKDEYPEKEPTYDAIMERLNMSDTRDMREFWEDAAGYTTMESDGSMVHYIDGTAMVYPPTRDEMINHIQSMNLSWDKPDADVDTKPETKEQVVETTPITTPTKVKEDCELICPGAPVKKPSNKRKRLNFEELSPTDLSAKFLHYSRKERHYKKLKLNVMSLLD